MAKQLKLSDKRQQWVGGRSVNLKGKPLIMSVGAEDRYRKDVTAMLDEAAKEAARELGDLFKTDAARAIAQDASITSQVRIIMNRLNNKFDRFFSKSAKVIADNAAKAADGNSKRSLKMSLKQLSGGLTIDSDKYTAALREEIDASIEENVSLIKSVGRDFLEGVREDVFRMIQDPDGGGLKGLQAQLNEVLTSRYKRQKNKAKNLALDQTRKMYNKVNASRMQSLGVKQFQWHHSAGSQSPRPDHVEMDGNIYSFDDLPVIDRRTGERGLPGQAINCKCFMTPVIVFDDGERE